MSKTPNTHYDFEGLVPSDGSGSLIAYDGLSFGNMGVVGKFWPQANGYGNGNGIYMNAHGFGEGITEETTPGSTDATITAGTRFSITSGQFAAAWQTGGEDVTFTGIRNGHVIATMTLNLDTTPDKLHFGKDFKHIDTFEISATSPSGDSSNVVFDGLKMVLDSAIPGPAVAHAQLIHHHDWVG